MEISSQAASAHSSIPGFVLASVADWSLELWMKSKLLVFFVAFGQGISYSNRNENTTGRLWCRDASQVRGPIQEGKTG